MPVYREDIVTKDFIKAALKSLGKFEDEVEIISLSSEAAIPKGENFVGDLATVDFTAQITGHFFILIFLAFFSWQNYCHNVTEKSGKDAFKSYKWIIKMLLPDTGKITCQD